MTSTLPNRTIREPNVTALPETRRDNIVERLHDVEVTDPYRWLEEQESPETRAWIEAQNAYTQSLLHTWPCRERLKQRITELIKIDSVGVPIERGGYYFLSKRLADQAQSILYRRKGLYGEDEILIDPNPLSDDQTTSVGIQDISEDGTILVYGIRQGGEDEVEIRLRKVETGEDFPDRLPKARYFGVSLKADKSGIYYSKNTHTASRIYYHAMGTDVEDDPLIFGEGYGPDKILTAHLSEDGRYLLIVVFYGSAGQKTELYARDIAGQGPIFPIVNDLDGEFRGDIAGDSLFMHTTWQAPNGRVLKVDLKNPQREYWQEIVPSGEDVLNDISLCGGKLFASYLHDVTSRIRIFSVDGTLEGEIALPGPGTASGLGGRWDSNEVFFTFTSFPVPATTYRYRIDTGRQEIFTRLNVPVDTEAFEVEQVWYPSRDGTCVPMFLVYSKGLQRDGSHPTLITGYGGFNNSLTPAFSAVAALWAEHGGIYVVTNLRGGGEFGEEWHRAGMLEKKQNVFDDFIAAAEWLIRNNYTQPSRLAISGGSNGGLLVGAALTQRPELYRAVVCSVPLLDMVRYHQFLVAQYWVPEYGSADEPNQFQTLYSYSPYHHVEPGAAYPAVLFVTGDADTRVAPLHARKMAALLQSATASERPILLHYHTKSGHAGGKPIHKLIEDITDEQSFLFWQLGIPV
jgi:prolyl oligopeptidase